MLKPLIALLSWALYAVSSLNLTASSVMRGDVFMTNQQYDQTRLAQWGTDGRSVGPFDGVGYFPDQLWYLKPEPNSPGYYYIMNVGNPGYRLAKWGPGNEDAGVYNGHYLEDQLWSLHKEGSAYRIYNKQYPTFKLAQWGNTGASFGTYSGANYTDQLWQFTPRFAAKLGYTTLWAMDNRQGSKDFSQTVTVTRGVKITQSQTSSFKMGLKTSLEESVTLEAVASESLKSEISTEISNSVTTGTEQTKTTTVQTTFTAPAGKNYRVLQYSGVFTGKMSDGAEAYGSYKVQESSGDLPPIPHLVMSQ